jgi:hypothetical protein
VLHALALLLWEPNPHGTPFLLRHLQRELRTNAQSFPDLMAAYRQIWTRVS